MNGFVSNDSPSSFLIVGKKFDLDSDDFRRAVEEKEDFGADRSDFLEFLGLPPAPLVSSFQVIPNQDYDEVMVGFGDADLDEYSWSTTELSFIDKWREQAADYFGDKQRVALLSGIVNPGR